MNSPSPPLRQRPNEEVADRLHSAAIHLLRRVRVRDAESGLTPSRLSALSVIVFAGPIRVGDLATAEQVRPPTISRLVKELETDGLVRRIANKGSDPLVTVLSLRSELQNIELLQCMNVKRGAA